MVIRQIKKNIIRVVFGAQVFFFVVDYVLGSRGFIYIHGKKKEIVRLQHAIADQKNSIEKLKHDVFLWQTDPFVKEKFCREKLHMAKKSEEIYLII